MLMGGTAYAQAKPIELKVGGDFDAFYSYVDQDDLATVPGATAISALPTTGSRRSHDLAREAEVNFSGSMTMDNGLQVGVRFEIEMEDCSDLVDESYLWFSSQFGRLEIGETDEVSKKMAYSSPEAIPNFSHHDLDNVDWNVPVGGFGSSVNTVVEASGPDQEKLNFFTPRIAGVQIGVSYVPVNCKEGNVANTPCGGTAKGMQLDGVSSPVGAAVVGQYQDGFGIAGNFVQKFEGVDIGLYAAWAQAELQNSGTVAGTNFNLDDRETWGVGGSATYMGITVGAAYRADNLGTRRNSALTGADNVGLQSDLEAWNVGARYVMGPWQLGVEYGQLTVEDSRTTEDENKILSLGVVYTLGPGITVWGGVSFFDSTNGATVAVGGVTAGGTAALPTAAAGASNEGSAWRLGTTAKF
jgi:predicted porin